MAYIAAVNQDSSVSRATRLLDGRLINRGSITGNTTTFSNLKNVQTQLLGPSSLQRGFVPRGQSGRGVKLTTQPHLMTTLSKSGTIFLFSPNAFRACIGTTL